MSLNVFISESEKKLAYNKAKNTWAVKTKSVNNPTKYNIGMISNDPTIPMYIGFLGEIAFSKYLHSKGYQSQPDFEFKQGGDGYFDFKINNILIDVKTRNQNITKQTDVASYIKILDGDKQFPLRADIYVFCSWVSKLSMIKIHGYLSREELNKLPHNKSKYGHTNIVPLLADINIING